MPPDDPKPSPPAESADNMGMVPVPYPKADFTGYAVSVVGCIAIVIGAMAWMGRGVDEAVVVILGGVGLVGLGQVIFLLREIAINSRPK